ncbi:AfsR/SARP family transcriptional regulator [Streptomyces sp. BE303]|uniref:AfsR/SARP family transcriptional regulator n=1 Tax=Streptomyces sp. BE303 TaxID=3002528 RepID=UPI002E7AA0A0|nr:BTAD domain-containing putative transcriptional regulator [Streptomyces sp. BE303]MED7955344.1 BTAD domain-containing putative transcriptional regulator [Streptomyces sp. BE303]
MTVSFGILGPLRVLANGCSVDPGSRKQQILLAALLCHANARVSFDSLVEALWDDAPPRTARKNVQVYVSGLRRLVGAESGSRISHQTGGYVLHTAAGELDALCFEQRARAGALTEALDLWRGSALDGFRDVPLIGAAAQRLDRRFLGVFEDWVEAEIAAGGGPAVIERVTETVQLHPLRERLRMLQMTALCQAGRRSEALAVYDELRQCLAHELGLPPSPALARFYRSLLCEPAPAGPREPAELRPSAGLRPPGEGPPSAEPLPRAAEAVTATPAEPRRGRTAPPNLLPCDPPAFTGRAPAARQLSEALARGGNRLAVVTGPLGSGKTALAVHVAHRLGDRFPDGRLFVRLRGEDGRLRPLDDVLRQLLAAVAPGRPEPAGPPDPPDLRWAWQLWLTGRRALVVVDDARRESEVRPLLPEAGESAVVVTARPRMIGLESAHRFWLSSLAVEEAVEFLGRVIGPDRVDADRESAGRIVRAAGLLPLGVRLVADRLAFLRHVPLREYSARMAGAPGLLDELCGGDPAVRARLAESIGDLPEAAHWAVLRLGLLAEPVFTLEQAAAVLDCRPDAAVRVLEHLLEASLLTVPNVEGLAHTVRYEMPALPYAYARETAAGQAPARTADRSPVPHP